MATIASLGINLSVATAAFSAGLKKADDALGGFKLSAAGIGTAVAAGFAAATTAAIASAVAIKGWTEEGLGAVDTLNDMAQKLGITTEALGALQFAAQLSGTDAEGLNAALSKMAVNLGKAAEGGGMAKSIEKLHINIKDLMAMAPEEQFKTLIEAIHDLPSPTQQAAAAVAIFGKQGQSMMQIIKGGAEGLEDMEDKFRSLGLGISDLDANKVAEANDQLDTLGMILQGLKNRLAVELAPYITATTEAFVSWATSGEGAGAKITSAVEMVAMGIAYASDAMGPFILQWKLLQTAVTSTIAIGIKALSLLAQGLDAVTGTNFSQGISILSEELDRTVGEQAQGIWDQITGPSASSKVQEFFAKIKADANAAAQEVVDVNKQITESVLQGAENDILGTAAALQKMLDEQAAAENKVKDEMAKSAGKIFDETRTPLEEYQKKVQELQDLFNAGAFDKLGGEDTFNRALEKAKEELEKATKTTDFGGKDELTKPMKEANQLAGVATFGSSAARSAILANRGIGGGDLKKINQDQLVEEKKHSGLLERIANQGSNLQVVQFA